MYCFYLQVSCGAWHVSAIVKNCPKLINTCTNIQEVETSKNDLVKEEVDNQDNANHFENESCDVLITSHCNTTKEAFTDNAKLSWVSSGEDLEREQGLAAKNDLFETICNDSNLGEKRPGVDMTTNTEDTTSYRVRHVDNKRTLSILANIYYESGHSVDYSNDFKETDSLNRNQSNFEEMARGLSENVPIQKSYHGTVKHYVLDSGTADGIQDYRGMNQSIVTDIFQPESKKSKGFKSKLLETVEKSSEEPTNEIGYETFNHTVCELGTAQDLHADIGKIITHGIIGEDTQKEKSEGFETKLEEAMGANNESVNHSFLNLGADNNAHNSKTMYQSESVFTENTLSSKSERFNETKDVPKAHQRVADISVWHSIGVKQHKPIFRQSSTPPSSKVIDANAFVQKQAMPVINLSFGSSLANLTASKDCQPKKRNPSFFTIQNMWINSSKLLREKQGKKVLTRHTKSDSEFVLVSFKEGKR